MGQDIHGDRNAVAPGNSGVGSGLKSFSEGERMDLEGARSSILWHFESLLLYPSVKSPQEDLLVSLSGSSDPLKEELEDTLAAIAHVNAADVHRGVLALDGLLGGSVFLPEEGSLKASRGAKGDATQGGNEWLFRHFTEKITKHISKDLDGLEELHVLSALVLCLNIFARVNWLGPPLSVCLEADKCLSEKYARVAKDEEIDPDKLDTLEPNTSISAYGLDLLSKEFAERCILGSPDLKLTNLPDDHPLKGLIKAVIDDLAIDGEVVYSGVHGATYFYTAVILLSTLAREGKRLKSLGIWRSRIAFVWQKIIEDSVHNPCPTLFNASVLGLVEALKRSKVINEDFTINTCDAIIGENVQSDVLQKKENMDGLAPLIISENVVLKCSVTPNVAPHLLLELVQRLPFYNLSRLHDKISNLISKITGFEFEFTGELGIRRKYQQRQLPQLIVKTSSGAKNVPSEHSLQDVAPSNIQLNSLYDDNDILEAPKLENEQVQTLSPFEQVFLLSNGFNRFLTIPEGDELALQYIGAIVTKCLSSSDSKWLITSLALWLRCKTEYNRNKTVERATFQLHSLSENYLEPSPATGSRLEYFWLTNYPSCWDIKREIARRMCNIGSFLTAFEIYKQLHMWEDAIQCLIIADRKEDAKRLVKEQLEQNPTPQLYCFLGDVERNMKHYETAWKISGNRCARAQRSLGVMHFQSGDHQSAIKSLELALAINPMRESSQFLLGCCFLKTENLQGAINAFSRVVALNPESSDAWANMSTAHMNLKSMTSARLCIDQAIKHNPTKWQLWDILLRISVSSREVQSVCNCITKLLDLGKKSIIEPWMVAFLVEYDQKVQRDSTKRSIEATLKHVTTEITDSGEIWEIYCKYLSFNKNYETALEVTFKEYRSIESEIVSKLAVKKNDAESQREHDVSQLKRLTNCLGSMVTLLKRASLETRRKKRGDVISTLEAIKARVDARTPEVHQEFLKEINALIETAEVEDVICVYEDEVVNGAT
ncbi:tetratricopeptide repeat domain containing protein [Theileria equi strain WA]|uniref:Tetratricopeptide repeat domain containing protein n=1 Tax=Theileria equi strain WA TaxID=1537102 RepID=L0AX58_THEEQ|nr:tetratricopeptide repeat domain containing protein [Theileria equi strain WA]AFZ80172.1 tetratricopeptide repeat domain containing protein [Theileria equi strain WA]|eukprot:XP_004829838.1 tetratricopeptide repeat domain containing protein [Theileria equi strain WA]